MEDYIKDIVKSIQEAEKEGDEAITITVTFPPKGEGEYKVTPSESVDSATAKMVAATEEVEKALQGMLDSLEQHSKTIECCNDDNETIVPNMEYVEKQIEEQEDECPSHREMMTEIYGHFDERLQDLQNSIVSIEHNIDVMFEAIPTSFDTLERRLGETLERRLGLAPGLKMKKKAAKDIWKQLHEELIILKMIGKENKRSITSLENMIERQEEVIKSLVGYIDTISADNDSINKKLNDIISNLDSHSICREI